MSFFLVGGPHEESLPAVCDEFVAEVRDHAGPATPDQPPARVAVVGAGPATRRGEDLDALATVVTSRWPEARVVPVFLDGPGTSPHGEGIDEADAWPENPDFALPPDLDTVTGIIVADGWLPGLLAGLGPAAESLSRLVRGGAPWLGFGAGAMATSVTALAGGWRLQGRQVAHREHARGYEAVTLVEGLGLVSLTVATRNDAVQGDSLLLSTLEAGLITSAVALDEGTCLRVDATTGRTAVLGEGLVRWFTADPAGVVVRHERGAGSPAPQAPARPRFEGLARVAAATRAAHERQASATTDEQGPTI